MAKRAFWRDTAWSKASMTSAVRALSTTPIMGSASTPSQTAWAVLGLMAGGEVANPATARGVRFLIGNQNAAGLWDEEDFTAVGFPRVFYLRYHGYPAIFPLWAIARYRTMMEEGQREVPWGL